MEGAQIAKQHPILRSLNLGLLSVGPVAVAMPTALSIFFLFSRVWNNFALLVIPPTVLYLWMALIYWLGYSRVNKVDKLATLTATTGLYLFIFPFYGFMSAGPSQRALGLLTLLSIMAGAFEIRRWRRRVSYLPLGSFLCALGLGWLLRHILGPAILYLVPAVLVQQSLLLLALCLPAELLQGGAGDPPRQSQSPLA